MDGFLTLLAVFGGLMIVIGRFLILHEARQISTWWVMALRFLPLAELMFLARYWEEGRTGAFTSLLGLALIMPMGGKMLWDAKHAAPQTEVRPNGGRGFIAGRNELDRMEEESEKYDQIQCKEKRLQAMNARLTGWYQAMQGRRAALGSDEASVTAFNAEAAAYHEFLAAARDEATALAQLRAKKVE